MHNADKILNVAAVTPSTRALGPGRRSVLWVQGCPFRCPDCIAQEWIPQRDAHLMTVAQAAAALLADPDVEGITFSGGEPMEQATALAQVIIEIRRHRDVDLLCFTGYRLEQLRRRPGNDGVPRLLSQVDVLIDGLYRRELNDGAGLRGSRNQRVHHLTGRLRDSGYDFEGRERVSELQQVDGELLLIGVPDPVVAAALGPAARPVPAPPVTDPIQHQRPGGIR